MLLRDFNNELEQVKLSGPYKLESYFQYDD
jgi:hypothetical protein